MVANSADSQCSIVHIFWNHRFVEANGAGVFIVFEGFRPNRTPKKTKKDPLN
jgi:hypothetical protein